MQQVKSICPIHRNKISKSKLIHWFQRIKILHTYRPLGIITGDPLTVGTTLSLSSREFTIRPKVSHSIFVTDTLTDVKVTHQITYSLHRNKTSQLLIGFFPNQKMKLLLNQFTTNANTTYSFLTLTIDKITSHYYIMYNQMYIQKGFTPRLKFTTLRAAKIWRRGRLSSREELNSPLFSPSLYSPS